MQNKKYLVLLCSLFILSQSALAKCYKLHINTIPNNAKIRILNIVPKFKQGICLSPGTYELEAKKSGYLKWQKNIRITNENVNLKVRLDSKSVKRKKYKLYVNATPPNAKIRIMNIVPKYQRGISLKADKYKIEVSKDGCKTDEQWIEITNQDYTLNVNLWCKVISAPSPAPPTVKTTVKKSPLHLEPGNTVNKYTSPPLHLEPGDYEMILFNGVGKTHFETTVKNAPLTISLTKKADCRLKTNKTFKEVFIKGGHILRFFKINPPITSQIDIALRKAQAEGFYQEAEAMLSPNVSPPFPFIFRAMSENIVSKDISTFWIQEKPIDSKLFRAIIPDGSSDSVSYDDAIQVIKTLNKWCEGKVAFELPSEEKIVHLARAIYNPIKSGELKSCERLREEEESERRKVKKLLGYQWQLTRSQCKPFSEDSFEPAGECDEQMVVKKGGSLESRDATECMPEYRAQSAPDIREPNTTFRLILLRIKF
jgi:hypothetical protein